MAKSIWLTYDLGVGGDYKNLYAWLDDHDAIDCGNNFAFFKFKQEPGEDDKALMDRLLSDIKSQVRLEPGNRLYVVRSYMNLKTKEMGIKGSFVYGKRMASPWQGYGLRTTEAADEG